MIEKEIKLVVSEEILMKCKKTLDEFLKHTRVLQVNYYYDTPDFLHHSLGNTLRVRQTGERLVLQYKQEKHYDGNLRTCQEFEETIQRIPRQLSSSDTHCIAMNMDLVFTMVGSLVTERVDYIYGETIISLDRNYFLGQYDCEIEIETHEHEEAEAVLRMLSIGEVGEQRLGKYSRFVKKYQRFLGVVDLI